MTLNCIWWWRSSLWVCGMWSTLYYNYSQVHNDLWWLYLLKSHLYGSNRTVKSFAKIIISDLRQYRCVLVVRIRYKYLINRIIHHKIFAQIFVLISMFSVFESNKISNTFIIIIIIIITTTVIIIVIIVCVRVVPVKLVSFISCKVIRSRERAGEGTEKNQVRRDINAHKKLF